MVLELKHIHGTASESLGHAVEHESVMPLSINGDQSHALDALGSHVAVEPQLREFRTWSPQGRKLGGQEGGILAAGSNGLCLFDADHGRSSSSS